MPVEAVLTYDLPTPRRPAFEDVYHSVKEDEPGFAVKDPSSLSSDELNGIGRFVEAGHRTNATLLLSIKFNAGTPEVYRFRPIGTAATVEQLTITDVGDGETLIEWPAGLLPAPVSEPASFLNDTLARTIGAVAEANGVRVVTRDSLTQAKVDANFSVHIY